MKIKKDKVIMDSNEYINLIDKIENLKDINNEYFEEKHKLDNTLNTYKCEFKTLNRKLRDEKRKFYRNRRLFEEIIDYLLVFLDENILKKTYNLSCKDVKKEILKSYDEDIKYN